MCNTMVPTPPRKNAVILESFMQVLCLSNNVKQGKILLYAKIVY
ncbi:hypothetical protein [Helicobacter bilis]|nr:hypothetical protein [Helicobacter bilis]